MKTLSTEEKKNWDIRLTRIIIIIAAFVLGRNVFFYFFGYGSVIENQPGISSYIQELSEQRTASVQLTQEPSSEVSSAALFDHSQTDTSNSGQLNQKVTVLVADWCPYCRKLEDALKKLNITYNRLDVEKNPRGKKIYTRLGGGGIPITIVGDQVIRGYDPQAVVDLLRPKKSSGSGVSRT